MTTVDPLNSGPVASLPHVPESTYAVLRTPGMAPLMFSRLVAVIGAQALTVAVGWELYERTGSAFALGLVGLAQVIPILLLALPAGHWADHYNRVGLIQAGRRLTVLAGCGLAAVSIFKAPVPLIYLFLVIIAIGRAVMWPATASLLPLLVPRKDLTNAITWNTSVFHFSSVLGPAVGGWVLSTTRQPALIYLGYAGLTLASYYLIVRIKIHHVPRTQTKMSWKSLALGIAYVRRRQILLSAMTLDLFAVLFGGATALLPVYAKDILFCGPQGLGLLQSALPAGSVVCAVAMAHLPPLRRAGRTLLACVMIFGLATIVFGLSRWFWLSLAALFVCGVADNTSVVIRQSLIQNQTPNRMRGRVSAVNALFVSASNELGAFESGLVAKWLGAVGSVIAGGVLSILATGIIGWKWPVLRHVRKLDKE